ncbi:hypothetical protein F4775DRAFT_576001 [Biscogniauxia sp. FL1348]|nr:hypothetical protein F4775DRAFT_576001 [Biscogniauxia sp. FL1348]
MRARTCRAASSIASLLALASVFSIPQVVLAAPNGTPTRTRGRIQRRTDGENVVLADCKSTDGVASSEIAYYSGTPDSSPDDIAQVTTEEGKTEQWANNSISGYFNTTGVTFRATLGPTGDNGDYAGLGNNGYGDFVCWQSSSKNLYSYDGKTCSGVYDCNHDAVSCKKDSPFGDYMQSKLADPDLQRPPPRPPQATPVLGPATTCRLAPSPA